VQRVPPLTVDVPAALGGRYVVEEAHDLITSDEVTGRPGVRAGSASEFSLFFHVLAGHAEALRAALTDLQNAPGYRPGDYEMPIASIHEARFVLFDDDTRLLFATSFDGSWDAYMEDFASNRCSCSMRSSSMSKGMAACLTSMR
jgi:hypothetical protein